MPPWMKSKSGGRELELLSGRIGHVEFRRRCVRQLGACGRGASAVAGINGAAASLAARSSPWPAACAHVDSSAPVNPTSETMIKTRTQLRRGRARLSLIRLHPLVGCHGSLNFPIIVRLARYELHPAVVDPKTHRALSKRSGNRRFGAEIVETRVLFFYG